MSWLTSRFRLLSVSLGVFVAAAVSTSAAAAPPWSAPAEVPGAPDAYPRVDFSRAGTGLLTWSEGPSDLDASVQSEIEGAVLGPGGAVASTQLIARRLDGEVRLYGRDRVVVVGRPTKRGVSAPLRVAFSRVGRRARRFETVLPAARDFSLDTNQTGNAAITAAACASRDRRNRPVRTHPICELTTPVLLAKSRGGDFSKPIRLGPSGKISRAATAVNARGDVLSVWVRDGVVYARLRTTAGRLQALQRLGSVRTNTKLSADLGDARRAVVAFGGQGVDEGAATGPFVGYVAYASPRQKFGTRQRLETVNTDRDDTYVSGPGLAATITSTGDVVVAWTGRNGDRYVVRAADARGRLKAVRTISDPSNDAILSGLAAGPRGEVAVVWTTGVRTTGASPGPVAVMAAARTGDRRPFGAAEAISGVDARIDPSSGVAIRFDPASGRIVAAWRRVGAPFRYSVRDPLSPASSTISVPNVVGMARTDATCALADAGLTWRYGGDDRIRNRPIPACDTEVGVSPDPIIKTQDPVSGTRVPAGGTIVLEDQCTLLRFDNGRVCV